LRTEAAYRRIPGVVRNGDGWFDTSDGDDARGRDFSDETVCGVRDVNVASGVGCNTKCVVEDNRIIQEAVGFHLARNRRQVSGCFRNLANQLVQTIRDVDIACGVDGEAGGRIEFTRGRDCTVATEGETTAARNGVDVTRGLSTAGYRWNYANREATLVRNIDIAARVKRCARWKCE